MCSENRIILIAFLDNFEYSSYNYRAFDLANHFNEWCGFDCDWSQFPNEETQRKFIGQIPKTLKFCKIEVFVNKEEITYL